MITIALLSCSTSWCQNRVSKGGVEPDTIPSTGGLEQTDTVVSIPISYIKIANSKMVELKYEKEINKSLRQVISNDSLIIDGINTELDNCLRESDIKVRQIKKERNIFIGTTIASVIVTILLLVK